MAAIVLSLNAASRAEIQFSEIGGAKQIWIAVNDFTERSMDGGAPNFVADNARTGMLSNHAYYFHKGEPPSYAEEQHPWWVQYEVPASSIPGDIDVSGTWHFWFRSMMVPDSNIFSRPIDSDWLLVNGEPNDLSASPPLEADWEAAIAARTSDDVILNNMYDAGAIPPNWKWAGGIATSGTGRAKQVALLDDKLSFRIYEREAYFTNARIDVIVLTNSASYVPTDADFNGLCANPTTFDAAPLSPAVLQKPQQLAEFTVTGANVGALDFISLFKAGNTTYAEQSGQTTSIPDTTLDGNIIEVVSADEIRVTFNLFDAPPGLYTLKGAREGTCNSIADAADVFELLLPASDNLLANPSFESGAAGPWVITGDALVTTPPFERNAIACDGAYFVGLSANEVVTTGTLEQSIGLPFGPGQYDLALAARVWMHDVLYDPTIVNARIVVDGVDVASREIPLSGWIGLEAIDCALLTVDWSGTASSNIAVAFDLTADGFHGWDDRKWGVIALDDVRLLGPAGAFCNDPFADADNDGDVDQTDFAAFQTCVTGGGGGPVPETPEYCRCFDRPETPGGGGIPVADDDVDDADFIAFEACKSGADVPADPACDD